MLNSLGCFRLFYVLRTYLQKKNPVRLDKVQRLPSPQPAGERADDVIFVYRKRV